MLAKLVSHVVNIDVNKLTPLKDEDFIQIGDVVMDDFGRPLFLVGNCHERVGTTYHEVSDMPVMRSNPPITITE